MSTFDHFGVDVKTNGDHFGGCTVLHIRHLRSADSLRYRNHLSYVRPEAPLVMALVPARKLSGTV